MKSLLNCSSLIRVAVIIVVMAFMASQVTDTYARGWGKWKGSSGGGYFHKCEKDEGNHENGDCPTCCDAWSKLLTIDRFELVMNDEAVLDKETCLVWERAPNKGSTTVTWLEALDHCFGLITGGRRGWRVPSAEELLSLADPAQSSPALTTGNPFDTTAIMNDHYWTTQQYHIGSLYYNRTVHMGVGATGYGASIATTKWYIWCVRGGKGEQYFERGY